MTITLHCLPPTTTAQVKRARWVRGRRPIFFDAPAMAQAKRTFAALLSPHAPPAPFEGPVSIAIDVTWPHPKSTPKRLAQGRLVKATRPDLDNWVKQVIDALVTLRFLIDDAQVVALRAAKFTGPAPDVGIVIRIDPVQALDDAAQGPSQAGDRTPEVSL